MVDELARRAGGTFTGARSLRADVCETRLTALGMGAVGADAQRVVLLKSRTYMNETGASVGKAAPYYGVDPDHLVVVHDELDLDVGQLRLKSGGGDNGHNGLKSIRRSLGGGDYFRVRVGVGRPPGRQEPADFLLSNFSAAEKAELGIEIERAADAVESLVTVGLERTQSAFNS